MLVEFSVGNFWSFKEIQTLQMQAAKIKSKFPKVDKENVFRGERPAFPFEKQGGLWGEWEREDKSR